MIPRRRTGRNKGDTEAVSLRIVYGSIYMEERLSRGLKGCTEKIVSLQDIDDLTQSVVFSEVSFFCFIM